MKLSFSEFQWYGLNNDQYCISVRNAGISLYDYPRQYLVHHFFQHECSQPMKYHSCLPTLHSMFQLNNTNSIGESFKLEGFRVLHGAQHCEQWRVSNSE